jgi:hypothetical protein
LADTARAAPDTHGFGDVLGMTPQHGACVLNDTDEIHGEDALDALPSLVNGRRYRLFSLSGPSGEAVLTMRPAGGEAGSLCGMAELVPAPAESATLGLANASNPMPRVPTIVSHSPAVYRKAINALLPAPKIDLL